jgi:hypothetical protein
MGKYFNMEKEAQVGAALKMIGTGIKTGLGLLTKTKTGRVVGSLGASFAVPAVTDAAVLAAHGRPAGNLFTKMTQDMSIFKGAR